MTYQGSCHCGAIRFAAEGTIGKVIECNCSMCSRKGSLLWFVPRDQFTLQTPEKDVSTYLFNKRVIEHKFCAKCGIGPYALASDPKGNKMAAINVRCLENVELASVERMPFDGRSR
jgi:hypothetical protein